jgi:hypothetical protein
MFGATAKIATWYMGLINTSGANGNPANTDTMGSHSWVEGVGYAEATRPPWVTGAAANQQIASSAAVQFSMNAADTIKGFFIATNNTKGGVAGTLWSGVTFSQVTVANGDTLRLTYTLTHN